MKKQENVATQVRLPKAVYDWLKEISTREDRSLNKCIVRALEEVQQANKQQAIN